MNDPWFVKPQRSLAARVRLVCLPHAGGGSAIYQPWAGELPGWVEVWSARLPGRESRIREPLLTDVRLLVEGLVSSIAAAPPAPALAIYGHSFGALLGYELAHALAARGIRTSLLMVSGRNAPHRPQPNNLHVLPDDEFLRQLVELYGGIPQEVLEHRELMALLLPILRADIAAEETYRYTERRPAPWPIIAYGGTEDRAIGREEMEHWRAMTASHFEVQMFPGDHFFIQSNRAPVLRSVEEQLTRWCVTRP